MADTNSTQPNFSANDYIYKIDTFVNQCANQFKSGKDYCHVIEIPIFVISIQDPKQRRVLLRIIHLKLLKDHDIIINKGTCSEMHYKCGCRQDFGVTLNNFLFGENKCTKCLCMKLNTKTS